MTSWLHAIADAAARYGAAIRVSVMKAEGSSPREAGASMIVTAGGTDGTIGGGALELDAIRAARALLAVASPEPWLRETKNYPLGPALGQCCGGYVKLLFERFTASEAASLKERAGDSPCLAVRPVGLGIPMQLLHDRKDGYTELPLQVLRVTREMLSGARPLEAVFIPATKRGDAWFVEPAGRSNIPLYLFGAGHVGRAVVANLAALSFDVTWVDTGAGRFPDGLKKTAALTPVVAPDPTVIARAAPEGAFHLVMTYSHPLDLAICHEVLAQGTFAYLGLIGSATKRARFLKRLRELGHDEALLRRLVCPIGVPGVIGKEPAVIAISVAAQLLEKAAFLRSAHVAPGLKGAAP